MKRMRTTIAFLSCAAILAATFLLNNTKMPRVLAQGGGTPPAPEVPPIDSQGCRNQINEAMAHEQRTFRSVIFGLSTTRDAGVGEVRYDTEGNAWYKEAENEWRSVAEGFERTLWSDSMMQGQSHIPPRRGLLETRRVTTSELLPAIGQSMRALQCRVNLICDGVRQSIAQTDSGPQDITVRALGCRDMETQTLQSCHFSGGEGVTIADQTDAGTYCSSIGDAMIEQEMATMELVTEYDAAYRTMLQLAGNFDLFLQEFRFPIIRSLRQMVNLVGSLGRIPCFLSSCDASPPPPPPPSDE